MNILKKIFSFFVSISLVLFFTLPIQSKVVGDTIVLGAAVSLTGKYSTNGEHTKNEYNMAVQRINDMGGVTVGGKSYKLDIIYYVKVFSQHQFISLGDNNINEYGNCN